MKNRLENLSPRSIEELLNKEFPPNKWLVDSLVPLEAITLLHGQPMAGKTWLMLEIAICVSQGKPFLGHYSTEKCGVLLVDEESGEWLLNERFRALRADSGLPIHYLTMSGDTLNDSYAKNLASWCNENDIKLVMVDSLVRLQDGDENSARDSAKFFRMIRILTREGITVILAHHNTKASQGGQYRGSGDIQASVDCQLSLTRVDGGDKLLLDQIKNRRAKELPKIEINFIDKGDYSEFTYIGDSSDSYKHTLLKESLLQLIELNKGISQSGIHQELDKSGHKINIKTLRGILESMETVDESIVRNRGKGNTLLYYPREVNPSETLSQVKR